jgi:tetratricopeptide (TPR) repeat protein
MIAALAAVLALAQAQGPDELGKLDERYVEELSSELARADVERPAILLRTPVDLVRAEAGAWDALANPDGLAEVLRGLPADLLSGMAAAEHAYQRSNYPAALERAYAVLDAHPGFPPALMLLGTTYFRLRRYDDCRIALERFLAVMPGDLWRTQALGHAYYSLGDYGRARAHYEAVIAAFAVHTDEAGESPEALRGLALCHMRQGDSDGALALLARVLALRPDHAEAYVFQARILFDEGRLDEALVAANRARELAPYEPQAWYFAMRILFDLGREDEANETEARWRELDRVAQQVRSVEMQLRFRPGSFPLTLRLCQLAAGVGDVETARARLADLVLARPAEVPEVQVRILVLDALVSLGDAAGARVAALALEQTCARHVEAWKRLELYYASIRDRVNQVRCASEAAHFPPAAPGR